jgi:hypothetical protein
MRVRTDGMVRLVRTHAVRQDISRSLARIIIECNTGASPLSYLQKTRQHAIRHATHFVSSHASFRQLVRCVHNTIRTKPWVRRVQRSLLDCPA